MQIRNTSDSFGAVHKLLHALVALLVIALICVGLYMGEMEFSPDKLKIYALHKSFGICVLTLAALRVAWRLANPRPAMLGPEVKWERALAHTVHVFLYVAMFAMPLSGWLMSSAKGFSVSVFGLFTLPDMIAPNEDLGELFEEIHEITAWCLIAAIALHAGGALKHHFIYRDATLKRMFVPGFKPDNTEKAEEPDDA